MSTTVTPAPSGAPAVPAALPPVINDATGEAPIDRVAPLEPGTPANIHDAGKAFREKLEREALATPTDPAAPVDPAAPAHPSATQPRNADGTFAPVATDPAAPVDPAAPATEAAPTEGAEPKVFVLKGEAQRGEPDIELDASTLPPEVVERLERAQKQGLRRAEYDTAMGKVRSLQADLDAVETNIQLDPQGFVLNHVDPAQRPELAATLLFQYWDDLSPLILKYWEDAAGRSKMVDAIRQSVDGRKTTVQAQVAQARQVMLVKAAIGSLVPDNADDALADEFTASAIAILSRRNEVIDPKQVPQLLATHVGRYFGAQPVAPSQPPARPKLAVRPTPSAAPVPGTSTPVVSQDEIARQMQARRAAGSVAPQGAGPGAVQRPGPPANATVQEASKWWRENAKR